MNRRAFVARMAAVMAAPVAAEAQQSGKVYRIGVLSLGPPPTFSHLIEAFREGMREAGHVEGKHHVLEMRNADGRPYQLPEAARALVARGGLTIPPSLRLRADQVIG